MKKEYSKKILEFVAKKPRTIQEVAQLLDKNWRTADSYIRRIKDETGKLGIRVFRGGTRGALKIVYWINPENPMASDVQKKLFKRIETSKFDTDFSPFDIYQYVDEEKRNSFLEKRDDLSVSKKQNLLGLLGGAEKELLIFSGNVSWLNMVEDGYPLRKFFEELLKKGIAINILARVDITNYELVEELININENLRGNLNIRHSRHPLRGFVIDDRRVRFKEEISPLTKTNKEISTHTTIFYEYYDDEWVSWTKDVFFALYRTAMPAQKRIQDLKSIKDLI